MTIIDCSRVFELRRAENEISRIECEAHRQIDQLVASTEARRTRIDKRLRQIEADDRPPADCEPAE